MRGNKVKEGGRRTVSVVGRLLLAFSLVLALPAISAGEEGRSSGGWERLREIERLMTGHTDRKEEARILEILRSATAGELNYVLQRVDLDALLSDLDQRAFGPDRCEEFLSLLARSRLTDLSIPARSRLVGALQRGYTGSLETVAIGDIFCGTPGRALTDLKNRIEAGGDDDDLQKLIYSDIDDNRIRARILSHIAGEAASSGCGEAKVLSDIDDTFCAMVNDGRYPNGTVYPGVIQLYQELDLGPQKRPGRAGDLVFVTARPGDRTGVVEGITQRMLRRKGIANATVLTGDLVSLLSHQRMAEKKLDNVLQYRRLFPEYTLVFIGDSGQGDILFGRMLRERFKGAVKAVLIHDVVATPARRRKELQEEGIILFDTYVGAAFRAFRLCLISRAGLLRTRDAAVSELREIRFGSGTARKAREAELRRDSARIDRNP
ncbi:phosphatase domain-containing protein [Planctomycetota bacterium]